MTVAIFRPKSSGPVIEPGDPGLLPEITLQVAFDAPAGHVYYDSVLSDQPAVYYRFGETAGTVATDETATRQGTYLTGVTLNQASLLTGDANPSIDLNGSSGYITVPDHPALNPLEELTVEMWFNSDNMAGIQTLFLKSACWHMWLDGGKPYLNVVGGDPIETHTVAIPITLVAGVPYHFLATLNSQFLHVYINGALVFSVGSPVAALVAAATPLTIGGHSSGQFFNGRLDEFALYPSALSKERAAYHYEASAASTELVWTTISDNAIPTSKLMEIGTKRGRADELRSQETGTLTGVLVNQDRRFDPANASSPYANKLKPVKQVRLQAFVEGHSYSIWRGDIQEWPQVWEARQNTVVLTATDAWDFLSGADVESISRPAELTGVRLNAVLDAAGWPRSRRDIDSGLSMMQPIVNEKGNAKALIDQIAAIEEGSLYISSTGAIVFKNRTESILHLDIVATFSNIPSVGEFPIADARPQETKDTVRNSIEITVPDGGVFKAESAQSILQYRKRTYTATLPFDNPNEAQAKAEWMLSKYKDTYQHIQEAIIEPQMDSGLWALALGLEIGDRVRFKIFPPGGGSVIDLQVIIEYIEHRYIVGRWTTKMKFSPASLQTFWVLGTSLLGTETKLAY